MDKTLNYPVEEEGTGNLLNSYCIRYKSVGDCSRLYVLVPSTRAFLNPQWVCGNESILSHTTLGDVNLDRGPDLPILYSGTPILKDWNLQMLQDKPQDSRSSDTKDQTGPNQIESEVPGDDSTREVDTPSGIAGDNQTDLHNTTKSGLISSEELVDYKAKIRELEKCYHDQMMLTLEFEKKYQECQLSKISAEFKAVYDKDIDAASDTQDQFKISSYRTRNLALLGENRTLQQKINSLIQEKEELTHELFTTKEKLSRSEDQLEKMNEYKMHVQTTSDVTSDSILNKLVETTKSLSASIEQNKLLHEALKSAKMHILMQDDCLSKNIKSKMMREEALVREDAKIQATKLVRELHETRQMARKEQELMMMAIITLYENVVSKK